MRLHYLDYNAMHKYPPGRGDSNSDTYWKPDDDDWNPWIVAGIVLLLIFGVAWLCN